MRTREKKMTPMKLIILDYSQCLHSFLKNESEVCSSSNLKTRCLLIESLRILDVPGNCRYLHQPDQNSPPRSPYWFFTPYSARPTILHHFDQDIVSFFLLGPGKSALGYRIFPIYGIRGIFDTMTNLY